jgi:hypothetical protein
VKEEGVDDADEQDGEHGAGDDPRRSHFGSAYSESGKDQCDEQVSENGEVGEDNPKREGNGVIYLKCANALEGES